MQTPDAPPPAVNPLPWSVLVLALAIVGVEIAIVLGENGLIGDGADMRLTIAERLAFFGEIWAYMWAGGDVTLADLARLVTYAFVHVSMTHTIFVMVLLLALGKQVGEAMGAIQVLVLFVGSAIGGALLYVGILEDPRPPIGGYPAVYGLIGGFTYLLWITHELRGESPYRAFTLIAALLGIQLVFGLFFDSSNDWLADLGGFATGFGLSVLMRPGGIADFLARIRRR